MKSKHINLLGMKVHDKITNTKGIADSICFHLYGPIQISINPGLTESGERITSYWYDISRIEIDATDKIMKADYLKEDIQKTISHLGLYVEDKVTLQKGIVDCVSFDLYGCIQCTIKPRINDKTYKIKDLEWYDLLRIYIINKKPVMERPNFDCGKIADGNHGPANKSLNFRG